MPTAQGDVQVTARATIDGKPYAGKSSFVSPVVGGTTYVGDIVVRLIKVWDGGGDGLSWQQPANWNDDTLPGATDDVYIPITGTVTHSTGTTAIRSLYSDGQLTLSGGTLTIAEASTSSRLTVAGGTLGGSAAVTVTEAMTWTGSPPASGRSTIRLGRVIVDSNNNQLEGGWRQKTGAAACGAPLTSWLHDGPWR